MYMLDLPTTISEAMEILHTHGGQRSAILCRHIPIRVSAMAVSR
jgi:hypothetical protein